MKHSRTFSNAVILAGLLLFILAHDAHAYIDPGSGSYILQLILAGLLGAAFAVKVYWGRIKGIWCNLLSRGQEKGNGRR